jgi:hypothetical protein
MIPRADITIRGNENAFPNNNLRLGCDTAIRPDIRSGTDGDYSPFGSHGGEAPDTHVITERQLALDTPNIKHRIVINHDSPTEGNTAGIPNDSTTPKRRPGPTGTQQRRIQQAP